MQGDMDSAGPADRMRQSIELPFENPPNAAIVVDSFYQYSNDGRAWYKLLRPYLIAAKAAGPPFG